MELIEPPASSLLFRTESPAFDAPPPDILFPERTPPDIVSACAAHRVGRFEARPISAWLLQDVFVAGEGLVFDTQGRLFRPSITQHHEHEIARASDLLATAPAATPIPRHHLPLVLGKKRGAGNYGHWLLEMLPMLRLALHRLPGGPLGVLVHDVTEPQLGGVMQQSLRRIGVADIDVRVSGPLPVKVDRLVLVEGLTAHGTYMSPLISSCLDALTDGIDGTGHERVFIARGTAMRRDFAQPDHVERLAEQSGYHVLRPEGLSLDHQIAALRDARRIAGALGAAMTSLVFARPGAEVRMFAGSSMPDTFFWFASTLQGHRYREMRCQQAELVEGAFYDRALLVPDDDVRRFLND